jgi:hypothetical protein
MQNKPGISPVNPWESAARAGMARTIIAGFSPVFPTLAAYWRQIDDALADVPALAAEIARLNAWLTTCRLDRANLAAAGRATIAACLDGERDPLGFLRDELDAQGFSASRGDA